MSHKIFKNSKLPFVELRYADDVRGCSKSHTHELITITAIVSGEVELILNNRKEKMSYSKVAFLNPNTAHCVELIDHESKGDYVLHLDKDWCTQIQKELFSNDKYIPVFPTVINTLSIYKNFIDLCEQLFSPISLIEKEENIITFISEVFLSHCDSRISNDKDENTSDIANKIKDYIDSKILDNITLDDLSQHFGLSSIHIIRLFKQSFELPIHSYILNKKVHKARELLSTNDSLINIALESGFYDQSHLNKSFKRVFSITPKEYQDNLSKC